MSRINTIVYNMDLLGSNHQPLNLVTGSSSPTCPTSNCSLGRYYVFRSDEKIN